MPGAVPFIPLAGAVIGGIMQNGQNKAAQKNQDNANAAAQAQTQQARQQALQSLQDYMSAHPSPVSQFGAIQGPPQGGPATVGGGVLGGNGLPMPQGGGGAMRFPQGGAMGGMQGGLQALLPFLAQLMHGTAMQAPGSGGQPPQTMTFGHNGQLLSPTPMSGQAPGGPRVMHGAPIQGPMDPAYWRHYFAGGQGTPQAPGGGSQVMSGAPLHPLIGGVQQLMHGTAMPQVAQPHIPGVFGGAGGSLGGVRRL